MLGIINFLSYKYGIDKETIDIETLIQIASYEGISIRFINVDSKESGLLCWGKGTSRMNRPTIYLRKKNLEDIEDSEDYSTIWFTIAHELAHFYLHPYLKYMDLRKLDKLPKSLKQLSGISQLEGDQFASLILIPTEELSEIFEDKLIEVLISKDNTNTIQTITDDIYEYCCKKTKGLPNVDRITPNADRNLMIRTQRFVDQVREKVLLYCQKSFPDQKFFPNVNLEGMSADDKKVLFTSIKEVYENYEEKI